MAAYINSMVSSETSPPLYKSTTEANEWRVTMRSAHGTVHRVRAEGNLKTPWSSVAQRVELTLATLSYPL